MQYPQLHGYVPEGLLELWKTKGARERSEQQLIDAGLGRRGLLLKDANNVTGDKSELVELFYKAEEESKKKKQMSYYRGGDEYPCFECDKVFEEAQERKDHMYKHHSLVTTIVISKEEEKKKKKEGVVEELGCFTLKSRQEGSGIQLRQNENNNNYCAEIPQVSLSSQRCVNVDNRVQGDQSEFKMAQDLLRSAGWSSAIEKECEDDDERGPLAIEKECEGDDVRGTTVQSVLPQRMPPMTIEEFDALAETMDTDDSLFGAPVEVDKSTVDRMIIQKIRERGDPEVAEELLKKTGCLHLSECYYPCYIHEHYGQCDVSRVIRGTTVQLRNFEYLVDGRDLDKSVDMMLQAFREECPKTILARDETAFLQKGSRVCLWITCRGVPQSVGGGALFCKMREGEGPWETLDRGVSLNLLPRLGWASAGWVPSISSYVFHLSLDDREFLGKMWMDCVGGSSVEYDILLHHWEDCQTYLTPQKEKSIREMLKMIFSEKVPVASKSPMISELLNRDMIRLKEGFWSVTEVGYNTLVVDEEGISLSRESVKEWASGRVSTHPWFSGNLRRAQWTGVFDEKDTVRCVKQVKVVVTDNLHMKRGKRSRTVWCEVPLWRQRYDEVCEEGNFPGPVVRDDTDISEEESFKAKRKKRDIDFA